MPGVDGFEATRRIRRGYPRLPVCALTADAIAGDKERCFDAGMNDYLTKPIQYEQLITTVQNWLRTNPSTQPSPSERQIRLSRAQVCSVARR
jgi:CheY-like chemotaxis protein